MIRIITEKSFFNGVRVREMSHKQAREEEAAASQVFPGIIAEVSLEKLVFLKESKAMASHAGIAPSAKGANKNRGRF